MMPDMMRTVSSSSSTVSWDDNSLTKHGCHETIVINRELEACKAEAESEKLLRKVEQTRAKKVEYRLNRRVSFLQQEVEETQALLNKLRNQSDQALKRMKIGYGDTRTKLAKCEQKVILLEDKLLSLSSGSNCKNLDEGDRPEKKVKKTKQTRPSNEHHHHGIGSMILEGSIYFVDGNFETNRNDASFSNGIDGVPSISPIMRSKPKDSSYEAVVDMVLSSTRELRDEKESDKNDSHARRLNYPDVAKDKSYKRLQDEDSSNNDEFCTSHKTKRKTLDKVMKRYNPKKSGHKLKKHKVGAYPEIPEWPDITPKSKLTGVLVTVMNIMEKLDTSNMFYNPVIALFPGLKKDYLQKITRPIDFKTINVKIRNYERAGDFQDDLVLVFSNCCAYNGIDSPYGKIAMSMWQKITDAFRSACIEEGLDIVI